MIWTPEVAKIVWERMPEEEREFHRKAIDAFLNDPVWDEPFLPRLTAATSEAA